MIHGSDMIFISKYKESFEARILESSNYIQELIKNRSFQVNIYIIFQ